MNKYEMMFIVKATMDSDKVKSSAENIKKIAQVGVDYVSSGALTHSAPVLDISLKHLKLM